MAVEPSWSGTTTTGAHSDEEHALIPTGSKTVAHCRDDRTNEKAQ